jgi:hypothetical protein
MTISVAPVSGPPPTRESDVTRITPAAHVDRPRQEAAPAAAPPPAPTDRPKEVLFDVKSGLTVVRTFDVDTGQVVAQLPTEAYLRLAQVMTAAVHADEAESATSTADVIA